MARHDQLMKFERLDSGERLSNAVTAVRLPVSIQQALNRLEPLERAAFLRRVISEAVRAELLLPPRPRRTRKKNSERTESDSADSAEKPQSPTQRAIQGADSEKTQTRRRRRTTTTG